MYYDMFNMKKYFILIFILFLLAGFQNIYARGILDPQAEEEHEGDFAEMRPEVRNLDELTVVFSAHDTELDFRQSYFASEAQIFTAIYEGLFSYHPLSLEPVPAMAERWVLSDDKMQWTFTLRRSARFWNGDLVRAEDFRA